MDPRCSTTFTVKWILVIITAGAQRHPRASTGLKTPQLYWSGSTDIRTITNSRRDIYSAKLGSASWYFYDRSGSLVSHLFIPNDGRDAATNANDTLTVVLGGDGSIAFSILRQTPGGGQMGATSLPPCDAAVGRAPPSLDAGEDEERRIPGQRRNSSRTSIDRPATREHPVSRAE